MAEIKELKLNKELDVPYSALRSYFIEFKINNHILVSEVYNGLHIHDANDFSYVKKLTFDEFNFDNARGLAINEHDNQLCVVDAFSHTLYLLDKDYKILKELKLSHWNEAQNTQRLYSAIDFNSTNQHFYIADKVENDCAIVTVDKELNGVVLDVKVANTKEIDGIRVFNNKVYAANVVDFSNVNLAIFDANLNLLNTINGLDYFFGILRNPANNKFLYLVSETENASEIDAENDKLAKKLETGAFASHGLIKGDKFLIHVYKEDYSGFLFRIYDIIS